MGSTCGSANKSEQVEEWKLPPIEERIKSQTKVKRILNSEKFGFHRRLIDKIMSIPLTNAHCLMGHEEVSLIIHQQRPELCETDCVHVAMALTNHRSITHPKSSEYLLVPL